MPLPQHLEDTTARDLSQFVEEQVSESQYLEFKRELPSRDNGGRHEFVADISALANSSGGEIIYGLEEDGDGRAGAVVELVGNADEEVRRLQDVLMNSVEPRIPGVQFHAVDVLNGFVVVVRVPQSWAGPHRVGTNQHFFVREGARKRQLNVPEIRSMFLRSEHQAQKIRDFRSERLGQLLVGGAPCRLAPGPILVAHFVPTQAALGLVQVDPVLYMRERTLPALGAIAPHARINLDGVLRMRNDGNNGTHGYSLMFRNGFFETVQVLPPRQAGELAVLAGTAYEVNLINMHRTLLQEFTHLGAGLEMTCMLSLIRASEIEMGIGNQLRFFHDIDAMQGKFDRDNVLIPDTLLPANLDSTQALKPLFDMVWQAAGMERSLNYNADGDFAPQR